MVKGAWFYDVTLQFRVISNSFSVPFNTTKLQFNVSSSF